VIGPEPALLVVTDHQTRLLRRRHANQLDEGDRTPTGVRAEQREVSSVMQPTRAGRTSKVLVGALFGTAFSGTAR